MLSIEVERRRTGGLDAEDEGAMSHGVLEDRRRRDVEEFLAAMRQSALLSHQTAVHRSSAHWMFWGILMIVAIAFGMVTRIARMNDPPNIRVPSSPFSSAIYRWEGWYRVSPEFP